MPKNALQLLKKIKFWAGKKVFSRDIAFKNIEGNKEYDFELKSHKKRNGSSAIIRAKNEERFIGSVLLSIYNTFDEIIVIDNASNDQTYSTVERVKKDFDKKNKIKIFRYPFTIARCGEDHTKTDKNSLHSLVYYYNWCLSKASYNYALKWDADMYLKQGQAEQRLKRFIRQIQNKEALCLVPIQTVYISPDGDFFEAVGEINCEYQIFPNRPYVRFKKADLWEALKPDFSLPTIKYPGVDIYELKDTRDNEFSHWSTTDFTTSRKKREWTNYNKIKKREFDKGFKQIKRLF